MKVSSKTHKELSARSILKDVYVVYVNYFNTMEKVYVFGTESKAESKMLELCDEWVEDGFKEYVNANNIEDVILDTYIDFWAETESDLYIGINKVVLED